MAFFFLEKGYCILGETCRFDHGRDPVEVDDRNLPLFQFGSQANPTAPLQLLDYKFFQT